MNCDIERLTTRCPFCGRLLLTLMGATVQDDPSDPRQAAVMGLELACDCEQAIYTERKQNAEIEASKRQKKAKARVERLKGRLEASNMPENWFTRGMSAWLRRTKNEQDVYDAAVTFGKRIRAGEHPSLYISGPIGTGKTFLASCLSLDLIRIGHAVMWSNVGDLLRSIRATFNSNENEETIIARFTAPPILVLDDLGKERPTEWASEQLFAIFNRRYDRGKITIVTTNYGGPELVKRLTPRPDSSGYADDTTAKAIVDRLRGTSSTIILEGDSKR